ncbi:PREDICTED: facilitated trehalose transporter Tret1-like [Papilio xuthus]|uniref:Facilitated trehalose transporter Tret1-like n=1 Tax=Papilio xuthus TaxID=66420 RepID=A0AAJ6Z7H2_PAPXU|nr:PREDICTED: facilitated trehalose transporter Tret1-like [Papilio xuthus]
MLDTRNQVVRLGNTRMQWIFALSANLALMLYGLETGWMSPITRSLLSDESPIGVPLTDNEVSLVASILCVFGAISAPFYSYIADIYGRKYAVITVPTFGMLSWITRLSFPSTVGLVVGRAFAGVAAGGSFIVVPMYVKEISQDDIRGLLGSLLVMALNSGILFMYIMGAYLDYFLVLWMVLSLSILTIVLMIKMPESPSFLVKKGYVELVPAIRVLLFQEATKTIAFLRGLDVDNESVKREIDILKKQQLYFESLPKTSLVAIFKNKNWRGLVILALLIITVHATNGTFAIINYGSSILASSGVQSSISAEMQALSFPVMLIIGSLVSMGCVERFGRKPLLVGCLLISACSTGTMGCGMLLQANGISPPSWLPVLAMVCTIFGYAAGICPLPFIIMSEMLNFQIRAKVMGLVLMHSWCMSFLQLMLYAPITATLGMYTTFFCFAGINLVGFFVALILLPETKGKSDEQIEEEFRKK